MEIARGAEAVILAAEYMGRPVVCKQRVAKAYRHPTLDARLRDERTRDEANLLLRCREAGVPVPILYETDRTCATLLLERIEGPSLKQQLLEDDGSTAALRLKTLGGHVARLHDAGMAHGDLTTSNVLVQGDRLVLIDFGLGQFNQESEARGVDLHLIEEALEATEPRCQALMAAFLEGYAAAECAGASVVRLEEIRQRGRYRTST